MQEPLEDPLAWFLDNARCYFGYVFGISLLGCIVGAVLAVPVLIATCVLYAGCMTVSWFCYEHIL